MHTRSQMLLGRRQVRRVRSLRPLVQLGSWNPRWLRQGQRQVLLGQLPAELLEQLQAVLLEQLPLCGLADVLFSKV